MESSSTALTVCNSNSFADENGIEQEYDSDDDYAKVQAGVEIVNGTCGTYVVADRAGLVVLPSKPRDEDESSNNLLLDDTSVHVIAAVGGSKQNHPDKASENNNNTKGGSRKKLFLFGKGSKSSSSSNSNSNSNFKGEKEGGSSTVNTSQASPSQALPNNTIMPLVLNYGDRVQIVEMKEDGWATLARTRGYLYADRKQLVKVGGPEDKACRLEAVLLTLAQQKRDALKEQNDVSDKVKILQKKMKTCMKEDYPIRKPTPITPLHHDQKEDPPAIPHAFTDASSTGLAAESFDVVSHASPQSTTANQVYDKRVTDTPPPSIDTNNIAPSSAPVGENHAQRPTIEPPSPTYMFSSFFGYNRPTSIPQSPSATSQISNTSASSLPASTTSGELMNIALNRSIGSGTSASSKVSFRTGMSGHRGLSRTRGASSQRTTFMRMSDHRGLGSTRKIHRSSSYDDDDSWTR